MGLNFKAVTLDFIAEALDFEAVTLNIKQWN